MMKKIFITISFVLFIQCVFAQDFKHGLILGGGTGSLSDASYSVRKFSDASGGNHKLMSGSGDYKYNAVIGYKLRYSPPDKRLFYDADILVGIRKAGIDVNYQLWYDNKLFGQTSHINSFIFYNAALSLTANYKIYKKLYAGIGLEPTYCFYQMGERSDKLFDMPLVAKLGYDFKYFDIAVAYKHGMFSVMESEFTEKGKLNDIQIQLFIPF